MKHRNINENKSNSSKCVKGMCHPVLNHINTKKYRKSCKKIVK